MKKIALDLDGVVFDSENLYRVYTEIYDTDNNKKDTIIDNSQRIFQKRYNWSQEEFQKFYNDNGLNYKSENIIVSTGGKQCLFNVFAAILNVGDEVLIPKPYWVSYPELVKLNDGIPVFVETNEEDDFKINFKITCIPWDDMLYS